MSENQLGKFMGAVQARLDEYLPEGESRKVGMALFPLVLKMGLEEQSPDEDTREETLGWAVIALLEQIAKLKGQEPLFAADSEAS